MRKRREYVLSDIVQQTETADGCLPAPFSTQARTQAGIPRKSIAHQMTAAQCAQYRTSSNKDLSRP